VTRVTRRVPHVEQDLFNFAGHLSPSPVFSEVGVARSFVYSRVTEDPDLHP
jgi:hypothetical protein